jgi:outer membrane protein TolC
VRASIPALETALDAAMNALDVMLGTLPGTHRDELAAAVIPPRRRSRTPERRANCCGAGRT